MAFSFDSDIHPNTNSSSGVTYYMAHATVNVADNGSFSGTLTIAKYRYDFTMTIYFQSTVGDVVNVASASGANSSNAGTGSLDTSKTWALYVSCTDAGCDAGYHGGHKLSGDFTLHVHSAPSGFSLSVSSYTQTTVSLSWRVDSWGCSDASAWYLKGGPYSGFVNMSGNDTPTITGLAPGTTYTFEGYAVNAHGQESAHHTVTVMTMYATPVVSISNYVPYNSNQGVSGYTNAIHVSASNSASNTGSLIWDFRINGGAYQSNGLFQGLNSGTTYTLEARATNPDGVSNSASMVIRTKYAESNISRSITINDIGLEHATFTVSLYPNSTASCTFKVTNSSGTQITSGSFAVGTVKSTGYVFEPSTQYTISATIKMSSTYDDITVTASKSFTTDAKNSLSKALGNIEFELPGVNAGTYTINSPSGNKSKVVFLVTNQNSESVTINTKNGQAAGAFNFSLNDTEWDNTYKALSNAAKNSLSYTMKVYTYSNKNSGYPENSKFIYTYTGTVTLTGKKKTGHLGVNNSPKRACGFIGVDNKPRRAVVWIGTENGPRRCI